MGTGIFYLSNLRQKVVERIAVSSDKAEQQIFLSNRTVCTVQNLLSLVSCNNQIVLTLVATFAAITGAAPIGIIFAVGNLCGQFFNGIGDAVKAVVSIRSTKPLWEKFELSAVKTEGAEINKPIDEITMQNPFLCLWRKADFNRAGFFLCLRRQICCLRRERQRKNHCDEAFAGAASPI